MCVFSEVQVTPGSAGGKMCGECYVAVASSLSVVLCWRLSGAMLVAHPSLPAHQEPALRRTSAGILWIWDSPTDGWAPSHVSQTLQPETALAVPDDHPECRASSWWNPFHFIPHPRLLHLWLEGPLFQILRHWREGPTVIYLMNHPGRFSPGFLTQDRSHLQLPSLPVSSASSDFLGCRGSLAERTQVLLDHGRMSWPLLTLHGIDICILFSSLLYDQTVNKANQPQIIPWSDCFCVHPGSWEIFKFPITREVMAYWTQQVITAA